MEYQKKIKADNRSSFSANNAKNKDKKLFITQFGRICEELNIVLETTSIATAKANVERENGTFKNRLIAELRHEGITTIDEANEYLNNIFIPKMNKIFSYAIDEKTSLMKENNYTEEELKLIISEKYNRIIDNASSISYNKKYYIPINIDTVSSWENNINQPSFEIIKKLAEYFGVTIDYLLNFTQKDADNLERLKQALKEAGMWDYDIDDMSREDFEKAMKIVAMLKEKK